MGRMDTGPSGLSICTHGLHCARNACQFSRDKSKFAFVRTILPESAAKLRIADNYSSTCVEW